MTTYKTKIGLEIAIPLLAILGITSGFFIFQNAWPGLLVNAAVLAFIGYLFLNIEYTIEGRNLTIRGGFLFRKTIPVDSIKKIQKTNDPLSSPAASLDRLKIFYNQTDRVMISPKDKEKFIRHLMELNPGIEVL